MNFKFVYKICTKSEWIEVKKKGQLTGSKKDLILLKVDTLKLDHLVWEQASDGTMFPHLYSPLDISNIVEEFHIILSEDGNHVLPSAFN